MKIIRSRKALSPVIATIILIAVTVAVSIAVAAWMGALTFSFMSSGEQMQLGSPYGWYNGGNTVYLRVSCPGGNAITIVAIRINNVAATFTNATFSNGTYVTSVGAGANMTLPIGPLASQSNVVLGITAGTGVTFSSSYSYTIVVTSGRNNEYSTTGTVP